jgi:hypothetical protein
MNKDLNVLTFTVNGISFTMKLVKAGTFLMGATSEMLGRSHFDGPDDDELPVHEVTISNDFFKSSYKLFFLISAFTKFNILKPPIIIIYSFINYF